MPVCRRCSKYTHLSLIFFNFLTRECVSATIALFILQVSPAVVWDASGFSISIFGNSLSLIFYVVG